MCVWACACLCVFACVFVRACVSLRFCLPAFSNMLKAPVPMGDSCNTLLGSSPRHLTDLMSVSFSCSIGQCSVVFVLPASSLLSVYVHHSRWLACPGLTVASSKNKPGCPYRHYTIFKMLFLQELTGSRLPLSYRKQKQKYSMLPKMSKYFWLNCHK